MRKFKIPKREEVSQNNQAIFDNLQRGLGFVPNMYAYFAKNETALKAYLDFANRKSTIKAKEKELIHLVTSQINGCRYCQSAHSMLGKMNGFSDEQLLEIRSGSASFDSKLDALVKYTSEAVKNRGNTSSEIQTAFFEAGYNEANLIDVVFAIGEITMSNYIFDLTGFQIDFPVVPELDLPN